MTKVNGGEMHVEVKPTVDEIEKETLSSTEVKAESNNLLVDFSDGAVTTSAPSQPVDDVSAKQSVTITPQPVEVNNAPILVDLGPAEQTVATPTVPEPAQTPGSDSDPNNESSNKAAMSRSRITTEEEAKAVLAERRRLAREQLEREAEAERQRLALEAAEEEERRKKEEEEQRIAEEEQLRLIEEAKKLEEQRLMMAIQVGCNFVSLCWVDLSFCVFVQEAQKREEEEKERRRLEEQARIEKEEADRLAREEAEK